MYRARTKASSPKKGRRRQGIVQLPRLNTISSNPLTRIREIYTLNFATTGAGAASGTVRVVSIAQLLLTARLNGYQAVADEVRIDHVTVQLYPVYGTAAAGQVALYLERDATAAVVASFALASDQREKVVGSIRDRLSLDWVPQEPDDYDFNLLNPGTVAKATFYLVGANLADGGGTAIPNATTIFTTRVITDFTLRGRP